MMLNLIGDMNRKKMKDRGKRAGSQSFAEVILCGLGLFTIHDNLLKLQNLASVLENPN